MEVLVTLALVLYMYVKVTSFKRQPLASLIRWERLPKARADRFERSSLDSYKYLSCNTNSVYISMYIIITFFGNARQFALCNLVVWDYPFG